MPVCVCLMEAHCWCKIWTVAFMMEGKKWLSRHISLTDEENLKCYFVFELDNRECLEVSLFEVVLERRLCLVSYSAASQCLKPNIS